MVVQFMNDREIRRNLLRNNVPLTMNDEMKWFETTPA